jgi:hypothetical protein
VRCRFLTHRVAVLRPDGDHPRADSPYRDDADKSEGRPAALRDEEITVNRTPARRRKVIAVLASAVVTAGLSACTVDVAHDDEAGSPATDTAAADSSDQDHGDDPAAAGLPRSTPTTALSTGDCIGELASSGKADEVGLVDCTTPHAAQVGGTYTADGESWPGKDALQTSALVGCPITVADVLGSEEPSLDFLFITPEEDEWDAGSRLIVCLVRAADGGTLSASVVS